MSNPSARAGLGAQLKQFGVKTVTAEYDGYGDSGQVGEPDYGSAKVPEGLKAAVRDLFYDILEEYYAGWEINEGSFGHFEWDLKQDSIHLVHNARLESFDTEEQNV
jgi:hypothetical protein